ncbi:MAG: class B sortase [Clostridioides sp.]|jgi:sortase B|nr:class B sortase [Clostridioides sp.]
MKKAVFLIFMIICLVSVGVCGLKIYDYHREEAKQEGEFDEIAKFVSVDPSGEDAQVQNPQGDKDVNSENSKDKASSGTSSSNSNKGSSSSGENGTSDRITTDTAGLNKLWNKNHDLIGWISIPNTRVNYPVMQTKNSPNFYLKHNFSKQYSLYGVPYIEEACDVNEPSDNLVIYGHHMNNGSMFAGLMKYKDESFFKNNQYVYFNTLEREGTYQIVAVFKATVNTGTSRDFPFYRFINAGEESQFNDYVKSCKSRALYNTGVEAKYGDKLITLATCENSIENGRLAIVAKRVN